MKNENMHIDWEIVSKSFREELLPDEQEILTRWLMVSADHRDFYERARVGGETDPMVGLDKKVLASKKRELVQTIREATRRRSRQRHLRQVWYAAAIVLPLVFALVLRSNWDRKGDVQMLAQRVEPGSGRVVLELNDGKVYFLDSTRTIETGMTGSVVMAEKKSLVYEKRASEELVYNRIFVPRAGEYHLTLSDGTQVWLNSDSEIRYPVAFGNGRRVVSLSGEAYFEVEKDSVRPFIVMVNDMEVEVYGTEFNVNTHRSGLVQTTLINGKVGIRVPSTGVEMMLSPNQMAEFDTETKRVNVQDVDTYNYTAWRSGEFVFENETVGEIMERLSLWYDMHIFYANEKVKAKRFTGMITRFSDVADVLHLISETATVQFDLKGNTITVSDFK